MAESEPYLLTSFARLLKMTLKLLAIVEASVPPAYLGFIELKIEVIEAGLMCA
jgi:hypothetical protein